MFLRRLKTAVILAVALAHSSSVAALDDLPIYTDDALAAGWENWSWSSTIDFAATDVFEGSSSISVTSDAWAAVSVKLEGTFPTYAGLKFDIAGANPDIQVYFDDTTNAVTSATIPLSAFGQAVTDGKFTTLLVDFSAVPGTGAPLGNATWDRVSFQAGGNGATYHLDNIVLVSSIFVAPTFLSAEPIGSNVIALTTTGSPDISKVNVTLNSKAVKVSKSSSYSPPDTPSKVITYLTLSTNLAAGPLSIATPNGTFSYTLPKVSTGSVTTSGAYPINPHVYGVNFPTSASYIKNLGVTLSRWGGNAVTAYNPNGGFTNAGADWYFENRDSDSADDWLGWVSGAGSDTLLTVPALDWVSKDNISYSFSKAIYPDQTKFDPYKADAGNGQLANGSYVSPPPDPTTAYTGWNTSLAKVWLQGLKNKPKFVAIDNEIEIAHSTHQDMHPSPMTYDEELKRVIDFATTAKAAIPGVTVVAPSTCAWWFYWTSAVGWDDTTAHNNTDFLPWFLQQMKLQETKTGSRLLDYLDIHYYFAADTSANDAAAKALRLRQTRSLWDTTYVDESWIGTNTPQSHQPDATKVQLIPRFRTLIDTLYPGTKLSISEWSSTNDNDLTGGLLTADALGIFGKYKVDAATYWATPNEQGPVGLAYWLYRGNGVYFASSSAKVTVTGSSPDTLGIYAGTQNNKLTLVIINKNPTSPVSFQLSNVPSGTYFVRHFGGASGVAKWQTTMTITPSQYIVVPSYTAIFLQQK